MIRVWNIWYTLYNILSFKKCFPTKTNCCQLDLDIGKGWTYQLTTEANAAGAAVLVSRGGKASEGERLRHNKVGLSPGRRRITSCCLCRQPILPTTLNISIMPPKIYPKILSNRKGCPNNIYCECVWPATVFTKRVGSKLRLKCEKWNDIAVERGVFWLWWIKMSQAYP